MRKVFCIAAIIAGGFLGCQKKDSIADPVTPVPPSTPGAFYKGYVPSVDFLGAGTPREGQLDTLGYAEDLDLSLISPFARVNGISHIITGLPTPGHQGQSDAIRSPKNSCGGWVVGYDLMSFIYTRIRGNFTGSPSYVWNQLNNGEDKPVTLPDALEIVKTQGCSNANFMQPFVPITQKPSDQAIDNAKHQTIASYSAMRTMDIEKLKSYLSLDLPIPVGISVDRGFMGVLSQSYDLDNGEYVYKRRSGVIEGGHFVLVVGYDDVRHAFRIMNSWGANWANAGFVWVDYDIFKELVGKIGGLLNGGARYDMYLVIPQIVLTSATTAITSTTATTEGVVMNAGGSQVTSRGIVYSKITRTPKVPFQDYTVNGNGLGNFQGQLTNLTPDSKYYVRAYALRANGTYHYGELDSFKTEVAANITVTLNRTGKVITATATGGTAPYQYSYDGGVNYTSSSSYTLIYSGTYIVKVKDALGNIGTGTGAVDDIVLTSLSCDSYDLLTNPNRRGRLAVSWTSTLGLKPGNTGPLTMLNNSYKLFWWATASNNPYYALGVCTANGSTLTIQPDAPVSFTTGDDFNHTAVFILPNQTNSLNPVTISFRLRLSYGQTGWGCIPAYPVWTDEIRTITW